MILDRITGSPVTTRGGSIAPTALLVTGWVLLVLVETLGAARVNVPRGRGAASRGWRLHW